MFKTLFYQWDPPPSFDFTHKSKGVAGKVEQKDIDAAALHKYVFYIVIHGGTKLNNGVACSVVMQETRSACI